MEAGKADQSAPNEYRFSYFHRHRLPTGGSAKDAAGWAAYAKAYNAVMIADFEKETTH